MIKSMTGFGRVVFQNQGKNGVIEIKSLNSKQLDVFTRLPSALKNHDLEIRTLIAQKLERGKIELLLSLENTDGAPLVHFNDELLKSYCARLRAIADSVGEPVQEVLSIALKLPEVYSTTDVMLDQEWEPLFQWVEKAIDELINSRLQEGAIIGKDVQERVFQIIALLEKVKPFEKKRIESIKEKLQKDAKKYFDEAQFDKNRLEQELFYYLEKLDITEEKVRLKKHCGYFLETLNDLESNGKKLNFIAQEMGREINTLGSKANDAEIQRIVVQMKDELEKIREQLMNVL